MAFLKSSSSLPKTFINHNANGRHHAILFCLAMGKMPIREALRAIVLSGRYARRRHAIPCGIRVTAS